MQELILLPEEESIGERADKYLAVQLPQYSRSFFQKLFKDDQIQIQNTPIKASYRITGSWSLQRNTGQCTDVSL